MPRSKSKKPAAPETAKKNLSKPAVKRVAKPVVKAAMKSVAKPVVVKKPKSVKKRAGHGSVRTTILSLLSSGSKTRKQLLELGGFSPASLFNVLKVLKTQGAISLSPDNRLVSAAGAAPHKAAPVVHEAEVVNPLSSGKALVAAGEHATRALHEALEAVQRLFVAPDRVKEKLTTLDRLVDTLPAPIADVLAAIREDYARMSPTKAPY